jgi:c-di-GMP-binding flagellar brake protein YcgR
MPTPPRIQDDPPLNFELTEAGDLSRYVLHEPAEIVHVLRALQHGANLITAYFNEGSDFLLTALLAVDDAGMILDYGGSVEANRRALAARKLVLIATHDRVKIQFALPGLKEVSFGGRPAFGAPLPQRLLRLQRREYFRLVAPVTQPLRCALTLVGESGERRVFEAQIVDISGGGIALMPPPGAEFSVGQSFESCRLELPGFGAVDAGLEVRNVFQVTLRNGTRVKRCGCQFVGLRPAMQSRVERYIMKIERERKTRR